MAGLSHKEIAHELSIKVSTAGTYVQRIHKKLDVRSSRDIIARCKPGAGDAPSG